MPGAALVPSKVRARAFVRLMRAFMPALRPGMGLFVFHMPVRAWTAVAAAFGIRRGHGHCQGRQQ
jgi:hypothetical protein